MLTAEDRMIRAVDKALEIVAQAIGGAIDAAFKGETLDSVLARSPSLKKYQASLFVSAANDPSTMLSVAIDHADRLGLEASELYKLKDFRNAFVHKRPTARARQAGLDGTFTQQEMARSIRLLQAMGDHARARLVTVQLQYVRDGAPEQWTPPSEAAAADPVKSVTLPPKKATRSRTRPLKPSADLSDDQRGAIEGVLHWWRGTGRRFVIVGPAGTGKTRLISEILAAVRLDPSQVQIVVPTNKAGEVLKEKLPRNSGFRSTVGTFHKLVYKYAFPPEHDGEDVKFEIKGRKPPRPGVGLVICDEASMLKSQDVEALEASYRVVYLGDPAQLPPVISESAGGDGASTPSDILRQPDAELVTIHRQSGGSSILDAAMSVRKGEHLEPAIWDDDATQVLDEACGHVDRATFRQLLKDADAVLVARNSTRVRINEIIRELRQFSRFPGDWIPKPGEVLVCADSASAENLGGSPSVSNGQQLVVEQAVRIVERMKISTGEPVECLEIQARFADRPETRGTWVISQEMLLGRHVVGDEVSTRAIAGPRSGVLRCDWGYALTVHKAQGSEWRRVLVVDHGGYARVGMQQWNYVALTRARTTVTVVRLARGTSLIA